MGWASRKNKEEEKRTAYIVFPNDELRDEYSDFMKRTRGLLETATKFMDAGCELDENAPDFLDKVGPHVEAFFVELILNYGSPSQLVADMETLSRVKSITDVAKPKNG
ncbi:MAG TPA: hypothetical protein VF556_17545 [Pyrinomonadaceae bacterium]|jgi:hypothetical protein